MKSFVVIFCVLLANCLANPIIPNYPEDIKVEIKTDAETLNAPNNTEIIIVHNGKINFEQNSENEPSAKIGLLGAILQRFPTSTSGTSGGVNFVYTPLIDKLIQGFWPTTTTTTTAATTPTTDTTTTTTTPTATTTTTPTTTTTTTPTTTTTTTMPMPG